MKVLHLLHFASLYCSVVLASKSIDRARIEADRARIDSQFVVGSFQWIREQINYIRSTFSGGVRIHELRALKDYFVGIDTELAAQLDKEIEEILRESSISINADFLSPAIVEIKGSKIFHNDHPHSPFEHHHVCYRSVSPPVILRHTAIRQNSVLVLDTEALVTNIFTLTVTSTVLQSSFVTQTEIVTVLNTPQLLTSTVSLTWTRFKTTEILLKDDAAKTNSIKLFRSAVAVVYKETPLITRSPFYVTTTSVDYLTDLTTVTLNQQYVSTMTLQETEVDKISVTNTLTKSVNVQRLVTETAYIKQMVTFTSARVSLSTVTECPKSGFLAAVKNKFG